jgi:hypothetical protein
MSDSLPWSVDFTPVGEGPFTTYVSSKTVAIKKASEHMKRGSSGVVIKEKGVVSTEAMQLARERATGTNQQHVVAYNNLDQLEQCTLVLLRTAKTAKPFVNEDVRVWLEMAFHSAKAMGVTPMALEQARNLAYGAIVNQQAHPQEGQKQPSKA